MAIANPQKPFVIPIFIPHAGCPHRCVFCDQTRTTGQSGKMPTADQIDETIDRFLGYRKDAHRNTEIAFYGGNFLGLSADHITFLLEYASRHICQGQIQGIRFSTRPDTLTEKRLNLLAGYPVTTVELGVQSMNNYVLATSRRGHSVQDIRQAVRMIKMHPYRLGLQMMVGLPGDTPELAMATGHQIANLSPDFVRIYPTLILAGSRLAGWYRQGRYCPMELEAAVALTKRLYVLFVSRQINVIRMGLQATDGLHSGMDLVAGPFHPAFGELVHSALWLDTLRKGIRNLDLRDGTLAITVHPRLVSRVKGQKNINMDTLSSEFSPLQINISKDPNLPLDRICLNGQTCRLELNKSKVYPR